MVNNFIDSAGSFNLSSLTALKQLNGDLRALILVSSTRSELLSQNLSVALKTLKSRVGIVLASLTSSSTSTSKDNENSASEKSSATLTTAKIEEGETTENHEKKTEGAADNNTTKSDTNSEINVNTPHKKRRLSEEPSSSTSVTKSPVTKPKDEKSKWKEHLVLFMNTLNLLIGMSENAIAAVSSDNNASNVSNASVEKPVKENSDSDQENIKKEGSNEDNESTQK